MHCPSWREWRRCILCLVLHLGNGHGSFVHFTVWSVSSKLCILILGLYILILLFVYDTGVHLTTVGGFNLQEDASWRLLRSSAAAATTLLAEFGRELRSKIAKLQEGEMSTLSAILHYDSSRFPLLTQFSAKELQLSATSECTQCETSFGHHCTEEYNAAQCWFKKLHCF